MKIGDRLLIVATDRISAFDYILATGIPDKGRVLTQMTLFWLDFLRDTVPNHLLSTDVTASRRTRRPLDVGEARRNVRGRMRGARLSFGFRLEGLSADRRDLRHPAARRSARKRRAARADFHARDQSANRPRRKHFVRAACVHRSARIWPRGCAI